MKRTFTLALLLQCVLSSSGFTADDIKIIQTQYQAPGFIDYVPDEIVVNFEKSILNALDKQALLTGKTGIALLDEIGERYVATLIKEQFPGAKTKKYKGRTVNLAGWYKITFSDQVDVETVVNEYQAVDGVKEAQPIGIHTTFGTPNDTYFTNQWFHNQANDHDVDAPEAWNIETGNDNVIIGIIDTGVRYFHKDIGGSNASYATPENIDGNMWVNWDEKNGTPGFDDDGNTFVDDWIGWDFVDGASPCWTGEDCNDQDNDPRDFNGHGSHCSGLVAALTNNGLGVAGIAGGWGSGSQQPSGNGVKVMACRIGWSAPYGPYEVGYVRMDYAAEALYYAADNGATIASCSWGTSNSGGVGAALDYFIGNGGLVFHAAGNGNADDPDYFDLRGDIVSVASTDQNDVKSDFSNYGTWVDVSAPGTYILSLYHDHDDPQTDYYAYIDGTSMACPLTAGVAALIWSQNPGWTADQVEQRIYDTADDIDALNPSYAGKLGAGRVNAYNAVAGGGCNVTADFSGTPTTGCVPLNVNFTDLSTGPVTSWDWNFGDGGSSTLQNPSHQYNTPGTYNVSLTVTSTICSDTETKNAYITVSSDPTANFTGTPTTGNAPLTVNFTDQSTGNPTSWDWNFGDGGTSTAQNPSHTYNDAGDYTVTLTVTNACGTDNETKTNYIHVDEFTGWCDDFNDGNIGDWNQIAPAWSVVSGALDGINDNAQGIILAPVGTVTDGTVECDAQTFATAAANIPVDVSKTNAQIIFAYQNDDNYRFIDMRDGSNKWFIREYINGTRYNRASWNSNINTNQWYHVEITLAANGNATLAVDGATLGSYKFSSAIAGQVGAGVDRAHARFDNYCVTGGGGPAPPVANFVGTPTSGAAPLNVDFTDQSTGTIDTYDWDFGDGTPHSALQNPSHTYNDPGDYTVSLTVTGPGGTDTETKVNYIHVNGGGGWCDDFNDGDISDWNVIHTAWSVVSGNLDGVNNSSRGIILAPVGSVTDGSIEADMKTLADGSKTNAQIIFAYQNDQNYRFIDMRDGSDKWFIREYSGGTSFNRATWNRAIATDQWYNVEITLAANGNVTLAVDGATLGSYKFPSAIAGQVGAGVDRAHARFDNYCVTGGGGPAPPIANFVGTPTSGAASLSVDFTDQSTGTIDTYDWDFGDGTPHSALQNPSHTYNDPGDYTVSLTVTGPGGTDTETKVNYIHVNGGGGWCDDFNDSDISDWNVIHTAWSVVSGNLDGVNNSSSGIILAPVGDVTDGTLEADMKTLADGSKTNAQLIFGYQNDQNYRFIDMRDGSNKWFVREYISGTRYNRASWSRAIATDQWYNAEVTLAANGNVTLAVDGTTLGSYKFPSAVAGQVGAGVDRAHSRFDNYCVTAPGISGSESELAFSSEDVEQIVSYAPEEFAVSPNYPNPFNPETRIDFSLPESEQVVAIIYNIHGQVVRTMIDGTLNAGFHTISWDATNEIGTSVNSGTYFMSIKAGENIETIKMLLLR